MSGDTTSLQQASAAEGMILVPGGTFVMGSDKPRCETAPVRQVTIRIRCKALKGARISAPRMIAAAFFPAARHPEPIDTLTRHVGLPRHVGLRCVVRNHPPETP